MLFNRRHMTLFAALLEEESVGLEDIGEVNMLL